MVVGLDRWRAHFADYADRYVLVGGVACEQLMEEAGLSFRLTKDFDVVLLVELLDAGFAETFWSFIEAGGYERREKADGGKLYRFQRPTASDYPQMIELFSRAPEGIDLALGSQFTPLPIDEAVASLLAILLDSGTKPTTHFTNQQVNYSYPDGLIMPLVYGLKSLIERAPDGRLRWKKDPNDFLDGYFQPIVKKYRVIMDAFRADPQKIGKNEGSFDVVVDAFETELLKLAEAA